MNVKLLEMLEITSKFEDFDRKGGIMDFRIFKIENHQNEREAHLLTAIETLKDVKKASDTYFTNISKSLNNSDTNIYFEMTLDFSKLENSSGKISLKEFLGAYYDLELNKPIIRGLTLSNHFYFDQQERIENAIDISKRIKKHGNHGISGHSTGFTDAFLNPPYALKCGDTIYEQGKYFIDFCQFLFTDLNNICIFKWGTDCSNYFDDGKEWWGTHFWTIYNPEKDWFIGVLASTTD
jgi:hypothetical protein